MTFIIAITFLGALSLVPNRFFQFAVATDDVSATGMDQIVFVPKA